MMAHLIHIGNSYGLLIPKAVIDRLGFKEDTNVAFKITNDGLLIYPRRKCRGGWAKIYKKFRKNNYSL